MGQRRQLEGNQQRLEGGRVTDGGWKATDGGWRATDGGWRSAFAQDKKKKFSANKCPACERLSAETCLCTVPDL